MTQSMWITKASISKRLAKVTTCFYFEIDSRLNSRIVAASIDAPSSSVYLFASNPANMPQWAPAFVKSIAHVNGEWIIDSNLGKVKIKFAPANPFGVLDHVITLPDGRALNNPMRVVSNGAGSLVTFTLFRQEGMSDAEFERDAAMVESDLQALKRAVEALPLE